MIDYILLLELIVLLYRIKPSPSFWRQNPSITLHLVVVMVFGILTIITVLGATEEGSNNLNILFLVPVKEVSQEIGIFGRPVTVIQTFISVIIRVSLTITMRVRSMLMMPTLIIMVTILVTTIMRVLSTPAETFMMIRSTIAGGAAVNRVWNTILASPILVMVAPTIALVMVNIIVTTAFIMFLLRVSVSVSILGDTMAKVGLYNIININIAMRVREEIVIDEKVCSS